MFSDFSRAHAIRVMEKLANYPCAKLFLYPVNSLNEGAYDYYQIIKKPMDITSIINNLLNGRYKAFSEWKRDVYLIHQNSKTYNGSESYITALASQLINHFDREFSGFFSYDLNLWKREYNKISKKLKGIINEGNRGKSNEAYMNAIEITSKGQKIYQALSTPRNNTTQNPAIGQNILIEMPQNGNAASIYPHNSTINRNIQSNVKDEFDSPPEISDESKGDLNTHNSHFPSFELATSKNNIYSNNQKELTPKHSDNHFNSIFEGININDLPPQIILSDLNDERPKINSNVPLNKNVRENALSLPSSLESKPKLPSIFGNIQFENLPPIFNANVNQQSSFNNFNVNESKNQTKSNLNINLDSATNNLPLNDTKPNIFSNNINLLTKQDSDKNLARHIPQPMLMPLPVISKAPSQIATQAPYFNNNMSYPGRNKIANGNPTYSNNFGTNHGLHNDFRTENSHNNFSYQEKKEESFENSGFIDVTDYF